jgi:hypothetical protein
MSEILKYNWAEFGYCENYGATRSLYCGVRVENDFE